MLEIRNLTKSYRTGSTTFLAIDNLSLSIGSSTRLALLGESGSGKTTLLRCIAGLETADSGTITLNGMIVYDSASGICTPPWRRNVGMVFQSLALWPHMTIVENVHFTIRCRRPHLARGRGLAEARDALMRVGLAQFCDRYPSTVSGGQQQRVALARAIVGEPGILLLDEPFSSVDQLLREQLREDVLRTLDGVNAPMVMVTHDPLDALLMGTNIGVMSKARLVQQGARDIVIESPASPFICELVGGGTRFEVSRTERAHCGGIRGYLANSAQHILFRNWPGYSTATVVARTDAFSILDPSSTRGADNGGVLRGRLVEQKYLGSLSRLTIDIDGTTLRIQISGRSLWKPGCIIDLSVDTTRLHVFAHC